MKNLKRTVAVFVSAIMVMALLAGCGGGSGSSAGSDIASRVRIMMDAEQRDSLDRVAEALTYVDFTEANIVAACAENGYYLSTDVYLSAYVDYDRDNPWAVIIASDNSSSRVREDILSIGKLTATEDDLILAYSSQASRGYSIKNTQITTETARLEEQGYTNIETAFYVALKKIDANQWIIIYNWCFTYDE